MTFTTSDTESRTEDATTEGRAQYLIVPRRGSQAVRAGLRPMSVMAMRGVYSAIEKDVVRVLKPRRAMTPLSVTPDEAADTYVVRMDYDRYKLLKQSAPPHLIIERDAYLGYGAAGIHGIKLPRRVGMLRSTAGMEKRSIQLRVLGQDDRPLPKAKVTLQGDGFPADGETDENGEIALELVTAPGQPARSLFVDTPKDHWTFYLVGPRLSPDEVNVVRLKSLKETMSGFPSSYKFGWGQRFMGLDQMPDELTGKGAKIAIIDSGADNAHPLLRHVQIGVDFTNGNNPQTWTSDLVGHGSHCAGVIAARGAKEMALRGFVPDAEIHALKVFPGGQFSSLLDALDYCIANDIDVVNMSLGSPQPSAAVEQKLEEAALSGIACFVAAGNSAGPVQYPASSPNVMAVAAIGRIGEFPDMTWDSATVAREAVAPDGVFSPSFTCFGPEVAVCAPGVAIISTVPDVGFDPESGTSMAAPHVTGFAALLIAHHPLFKGPLAARNQQRVGALFQLIRSSAAPYNLGPGRAGAGVPKLHGFVQAMRPTMIAPMPVQPQPTPVAAAPAAQAVPQPLTAQTLQELLASNLGRALLALLGSQAPQLAGGAGALQVGPQLAAQGAVGAPYVGLAGLAAMPPQTALTPQLEALLGTLFYQGGPFASPDALANLMATIRRM